MEQQKLINKILEKLDHITGRKSSLLQGDIEQAVFDKLDQVEKIISSIQKYLPKRVIDKILLNPDGVKVEGERRQVTVLFGDLSGFTAMSETMDPEQVVEVVNQYFDTMVEIASRYGGHIDKFMGDALMVLFGAPVAHEDDPLRACMAAIEMLEAMDRFSAERKMDLAMSIGLNTGEVVALNVGSKERMEYTVIGDGVNLAARLEKVATARECVIGENTYRQVKGKIKLKKLKPVMVKGKSKPQNVYLIQGRMEEAGQSSALRSGSIKLVGRMAEMEGIKQAIDQAKNAKGQMVAVTGESGVGKSRIAKELELLARDQGFKFTKGKCYSYSSNVAYQPFIRQLNVIFNIEEKDSGERKHEKIQEALHMLDLTDFEPFLGSLLGVTYSEIEGLDPEKRKRKTFEGIRELYLRQSKKQPLAVAFEDLQWADTLSLELLEHLVDILPNESILICADFRPELALPFIAKPYCLNINLKPLKKQETWQMVSALAAVSDVDDLVLDKLIERTEGNPLFIEEVIRHLISRRLVKREGESLVATKRLGKMALPNTVASVVLGRIDKLGEELRRLLQYSAVIGKEFDRAVLAKLLKEPEEKIQGLLDNLEHFEGLLYSKLIDTKRVYEFHSTTTHEAAYSTLLKQRRKELHGKVARTLENEFKDNLFLHLEDLAHHYYNSSHQDKAVSYLHRAGDKSRELYANPEAIEFYEKCLFVLKAIKQNKEMLLEMAEVLGAQGAIYRLIGQRDKALKNFNKAVRIAHKEKEDKAERKYLLTASITYDMLGQPQKSRDIIETVLITAEKTGDLIAQAIALHNKGNLLLHTGSSGEASTSLLKALAIYHTLKNEKDTARAYGSLGEAYELTGDMEKAAEHYQKAIDTSVKISYLEGIAAYSNNLGQLFLVIDEMDEADKNFNTAFNMARKIGDKRIESLSSGNMGIISAMAGNYELALKYFSKSLLAAEEIQELWQKMQMKNNIGCVYQLFGDPHKALEHHLEAANISIKINDIGNESEIRRNLGLDYILLGKYDTSLTELLHAYKIADQVGDPRMQAYIKANLGALNHLLGQLEQADKNISEALEEAKKARDPEVILTAARALVEFSLDTGDLIGAEEHVNRLLGLAEKTQNKREMAYGLLNLSRLLMQKDEKTEMVEPLSESLGLARELKDKMLLGRIFLLFAQKALAEGNIKEAEDYLKDAREMADKTESPELLSKVHSYAGKLYQIKELPDQAQLEKSTAMEILEDIKAALPKELQQQFYDIRIKVL